MTELLPQTGTSPLPRPDERSAPYWDALRRGELVLPRCAVCEALNHPWPDRCRVCGSPQLDWVPAGSGGHLFSWAVEERTVIPGLRPPYVIAQVTPDGCAEGEVRLIGTLLVADPSELAIGRPVRLVPTPVPGADVVVACYVLR